MRKILLPLLIASFSLIPTGVAQAEAEQITCGSPVSSGETQSADTPFSTRAQGRQEKPSETPGSLQLKPTKLEEFATSGRLPPTKIDPYIVPSEALIYGEDDVGVGDYGLQKSVLDDIKSLPDCTTCAPSRFGSHGPSAWDYPE